MVRLMFVAAVLNVVIRQVYSKSNKNCKEILGDSENCQEKAVGAFSEADADCFLCGIVTLAQFSDSKKLPNEKEGSSTDSNYSVVKQGVLDEFEKCSLGLFACR